ncbi:hypothetical protein Tco_0603363 [Tanacetum coccineum]
MAEPLPPNHVFDFPTNDSTPELEDPVMEVEEDPMEDLEEDPEEDLDMDLDEDKDNDDDWLMAPITTSDFLPWIPLTQPNIYEVGGPSSAVPEVDGVSDAQVADNIAIAELQPRMDAVEEGVQTLAEQGVLVASKLDETTI